MFVKVKYFQIVPNETKSEAFKHAEEIAEGAPLSIKSIKETLRTGLQETLTKQTARENDEQAWQKTTEDFKEGINSVSENALQILLGNKRKKENENFRKINQEEIMTDIREFQINIPQQELDDLQRRLDQTRFPEAETPDDWSQGLPLEYAMQLCDYWRDTYDWRSRESYFNGFDQYFTEIDDLDIHFIHVKSTNFNARPLLVTHGWPGSVVEFHKVIKPLTDPQAHSGNAENAFHVVCPSLPGYGFSGKPTTTAWGVDKIAKVWNTLMTRLGYDSYFAQGGDWGSAVTTAIGIQAAGNCTGLHVNMHSVRATKAALENPDESDKRALAGAATTSNGEPVTPNSKAPDLRHWVMRWWIPLWVKLYGLLRNFLNGPTATVTPKTH